jgi:hypothetical protein
MTITFYNRTELLLNRVLPQLWIGRAANGDNNLLPWPPCSPDLTHILHISFFGGSLQTTYVPPLSTPIQELRDNITHALQAITADMLHQVWDAFDYRVDVCRVTQGAHIERL